MRRGRYGSSLDHRWHVLRQAQQMRGPEGMKAEIGLCESVGKVWRTRRAGLEETMDRFVNAIPELDATVPFLTVF